jgi:hypothetical protein
MVMARRETLVQLTEELVDALDEISATRGVRRSALIREVLQTFVAAEDVGEKERLLVDGYTRLPPDTPDEWGDLAKWGDAAAADAYAEEPLE